MRIVYDASAKQSANHPSLNDSLYAGPNLISDLLSLLLEFRKHDIVLLADIEKAFLQVGLHPEDRDATRFFWLKDPTQPFSTANIAVYRFCRVPFGATSSPFLLAATLRYHLMHTDGQAASMMLNHFYVDNLVTGAKSVTEASAFYLEAKRIMSSVGMNLREWVSNSPEFINSIPENDRAIGNVIKVLGIPWNVLEDSIYIKGVPALFDSNIPPTKRQILQTIANVFDPLGLVSPVVIQAKIFIQKLWKVGLFWDDVPSVDVLEEWRHINAQLSLIDKINIPRHLEIDNAQLHVFVDASSKAYAAVAYIRSPSATGFTSSLVCSKSRVAPIKMITCPRLELMAALVGCQLADFIRTTYSITTVQLWSDSEIVLHWIRNLTQKQGVFVSNRIKAITDFGFPFRYVPTRENPADLPSRGVDTANLASSIWWQGPTWLSHAESTWPADTITKVPVIPPDPDTATISVITKVSVHTANPPFGIDIQRFSSLSKVLRVTALCSRFIQRLCKKDSLFGSITAEEYSSAKKSWIQFVQRQHFGAQWNVLKNYKSDSTIRSMGLVLEDKLVKCQGRFDNCNLTDSTKKPILLPKNDKFTDLLILDQHNQLYHQGVRHTLSMLRQSYWIPSGRQQVRFVLKKCQVCRLWEGGAYSNPPSPPLPSMRVTKSPAFSFTGCDFAGPLLVFQNATSTKAYICLFTCAVTRAVHLELVEDLTTHRFLMALRRFISRRGCAQEIISDNAKTFKLSKQVLDKLWHDVIISPDTVNYVAAKGIKWKFNVERAPWWGGFFEKMVGLTKRTLIKAIGKSKLDACELSTVFAEVEAILNSRPLTYVYDDLANGLPLCPADFLSEASSFALPQPILDPEPEYKDPLASTNALINKLRIKQQVLDRFWRTWLNDYLPGLREVHHQHHKTTRSNPYMPRIGDVVLIKHDGLKRAHWKLGIIQQLYPGKDGEIRAVQLKSKDGQLLQRPISLLYPLEIETTEVPVNSKSDEMPKPKEQRAAATKAKERIKEMASDTQGFNT